jgi:hypothetical protein
MNPRHIRIFLSSPGDVPEERSIARELLEGLQRKAWLKDRITVRVVAWEQNALSATETPQQSVIDSDIPPSACDFTILILWGRLGTLLPPHMCKADGGRYRSGTEWEFFDASKSGARRVFIYVRTSKPTLEIDDPDEAEKKRQYAAVKAFLSELRNPDGSLNGGINGYATPDEFRSTLENHMEGEVRRLLETPEVPSRPKFSVFLAAADGELRATRGRLQRSLEKEPELSVFEEVPPPYEKEEHAERVVEQVRAADLCVHLLGNKQDFTMENAAAGSLTYPLEQARLGLAHASSQLVLLSRDFDPKTLPVPEHQAFMLQFQANNRETSRLEFQKVTSPQMLEAILAKRRAVERARASQLVAPAASTAAIVVHARDRESRGVTELLDYLQERVTPELVEKAEAPSPADATQRFLDGVRKARFVLVVYGAAEDGWVFQRVGMAMQQISLDKLPTRIGVYVTPPHAGELSFKFPGVTVLDGTRGIESAAVEAFLGLARAAE